jgi:hypothetical protein
MFRITRPAVAIALVLVWLFSEPITAWLAPGVPSDPPAAHAVAIR